MHKEYSCGAIVYRLNNHQIEYLIVQEMEDYHGFPKGHVELNETAIETARREVKEETDLDIEIIDDFKAHDAYYIDAIDAYKEVTYFIALSPNMPLKLQISEIKSAAYYNLVEALKLIERASSRKILIQADNYLKAKYSLSF